MNPWSTDACWQNFSSLYREVVAAKEAPNEIGKFHHLTSSLYFGIAALEAFLNQRMRMHLKGRGNEDHIFDTLRGASIMKKLKKWPNEILSKESLVTKDTMSMLKLFNEIRGDLTHPKTQGHEIYSRLESVEPELVLLAVSEYIVCFYEAAGEVFPYWMFGWNYLNPRQDTHEIMVIHNQQFLYSLLAMGFQVPAWDVNAADHWQVVNMSSFSGYQKVNQALESYSQCEPKVDNFPFQPKLCRRWWAEEHQKSCGHITKNAIRLAKLYDSRRFRRAVRAYRWLQTLRERW